MNIKKHFSSQKPWVKGGVIGVLLCTAFFSVYPIIYFPLVENEIGIPDTALILPTVTGHTFVFFSHFIIEGSTIPATICTETETHCVSWSLTDDTGTSTPFTDPEGDAGYCLEEETTPKSSCVDRVESAIAITSFIALEAIYFVIGAVIATIVEKRGRTSSK